MSKIIFFVFFLIITANSLFSQDLEKDKKSADYLLNAKFRSNKKVDSIFLAKNLIGKNIKGWGIIKVNDLVKIRKLTNWGEPKHINKYLLPTSWDRNDDFDPDDNNFIIDSGSFIIRLKLYNSNGNEAYGISYIKANHIYQPKLKQWKTNINLNTPFPNNNLTALIKLSNKDWVPIRTLNSNYFKLGQQGTRLFNSKTVSNLLSLRIAYKVCESCAEQLATENSIISLPSKSSIIYIKRTDNVSNSVLYFEMFFSKDQNFYGIADFSELFNFRDE
ncbi:MAG: hypothetical protein ABI402_05910 [Ferruginibacter sp.]